MFSRGANSLIWKRTEPLLSENNLAMMMSNLALNEKVEYSHEDL